MAEFDVGVELTPEPGSVRRFETEAKAIANRIEPIINKALSVSQAQAKKIVAPLEEALQRAFKNSSKQIAIKVGVDKSSAAKVTQDVQKLIADKTVDVKVRVDQAAAANVQSQIAAISGKKIGGAVGPALVPSLNAATSSINQFTGATVTSTERFARFIAGFAGVGIASAGLAQLAQTAVAAGTQLDTQLRGLQALTTVLGASAAESFDAIRAAANKLPGTFTDIQTGVVQLSSVLGLNLHESINLFETLTGAALASGKGMGEVNGVIRQLGQISAKGRVQLEELSIIAENIPGLKVADIIAQIAKQMGITTEEARKLLSQGLLPASEAMKAIETVAKNVPGAMEAIALAADGLQTNLDTLKDSIQVGLGQAFIDATKAAGGGIATFGNLAPVMEKLALSLTPILTTFVSLVPVITTFGGTLNTILIPVNALLKAFNFLGPVTKPLLTTFLTFKTVSTVFAALTAATNAFQLSIGGMAAKTAIATAVQETGNKALIRATGSYLALNAAVDKHTVDAIEDAAAIETNTIALNQNTVAAETNAAAQSKNAVASGLAARAASGASSALSLVGRAVPAITAVAVAWQFVGQVNADATNKAKEYIDLVTKGIPIDDLEARRNAYRQVAEEAARAGGEERGVLDTVLKNLNPFSGSTKDQSKRREEAQEFLSDLALEEEFVKGIGAQTGQSYIDAYNAALAQGVDFTKLDDLSEEQRKKIADGIIQQFKDANIQKAAEDAAQNAKDAFADAFSNVSSAQGAFEAVRSAEEGLVSAQESVNAATARHNELLNKQKALLADTARDARELADANRAVERSEIALRELLEEQADLPSDAAALTDRRTAAVIKLNQVLREQEQAEESLNETAQQGVRVNLAGLSASEIATALANARLGLASQTAKETKKETTEKKSQAQIDEERILKEIAVRDARRDIEEIDNRIRDNSEKQLDIVGQIEDAEQARNDALAARDRIQAGDTARSRELKQLAIEIKGAEDDITKAVEARARAEETVRNAKLDQRETNAKILGDEKAINDVLFERIGILNKTPGGEALAKQTLITSLPGILSQAGFIEGGPGEGFPQLTESLLNELVRAIQNAPAGADLRAILRRILAANNIFVPGLRHGGIVGKTIEQFASGGLVGQNKSLKGGQLIIAGEGGKEELILPLRGTKERALELLNEAAKVANPEIRKLLEQAIGSKKLSGFKRGGIVGGHGGRFAEGGIVKGETVANGNPLGIIDTKLDIVGADVDSGFEEVEDSLENQDAQIKRLFAISRGLTRTLVSQQRQLVTLNTAVTNLGTTLPAQINAISEVQNQQADLLTTAALNIQTTTDSVNQLATSLSGIETTLRLQGEVIGATAGSLQTVATTANTQNDSISQIRAEVNNFARTVVENINATGLSTVNAVNQQTRLIAGIARTLGLTVNFPEGSDQGPPGTDLIRVMADFVREIARRHGVPGAAEGAVITGTPGSYGTLMRVGEYSRPESIVPLRSKEDAARVIRNSIPYAVPEVKGMLTRALATDQPSVSTGGIIPVPVGSGSYKSAAQAKKEKLEWADAIGESVARSLIAKGVGSGESGPITVVIEGTQYNEVDAKNLVREIERKRNRY